MSYCERYGHHLRPKTLEFATAGYGRGDRLQCRPGIAKCGEIEDGISFTHAPQSGGWVLAFSDLEKLYLLAKEARNVPTSNR